MKRLTEDNIPTNPETVFELLIEQGGPSMEPGLETSVGSCCYRGAEGRRCAVGWLITDGEWQQLSDPEEASVMDFLNMGYCMGKHFSLETLLKMQNAHDCAADMVTDETDVWPEILAEEWQYQGLPLPAEHK